MPENNPYGINYSYRDNTINNVISNEVEYNAKKNDYYSNLADTNYQNSVDQMQTNYTNYMNKAYDKAAQSKNTSNIIENAISTGLGYKTGAVNPLTGAKTSNLKTDINNWASDKLGATDYSGNQINPGAWVDEKVDKVGNWLNPKGGSEFTASTDSGISGGLAGANNDVVGGTNINEGMSADALSNVAEGTSPYPIGTTGIASTAAVAGSEIGTGANAISSASQSYNPNLYKQVGTEIIDTATGEVVDTAVSEVASTVGTQVAGEVGTQVVATNVAADGASAAVTTGTNAATNAAGTAVKTAAAPPVSGGLWTVPVDIGLHYLSDDGDDSTYTGAEVATDIGSLALDVATFDWVGAAMQLYDIGSQWVRRNKLQKEKKTAIGKQKTELSEAKAERDVDYQNSKQYTGYNYQGSGIRSGFGRGELGGFSKYI
jgi:hypothetical protein